MPLEQQLAPSLAVGLLFAPSRDSHSHLDSRAEPSACTISAMGPRIAAPGTTWCTPTRGPPTRQLHAVSGSASTAQHASSDRGATRDRPPLRQGQLLQGHLYDENPLPPRQRALLADCPLDPGPWPLAADWPLAVQPWTLAAAPLTTAPQPSTHSLSGSSAAISGCLGSLPSLVPDHLQREVQGQRAGFSHSCHHSYHTTYHACSGSHDGPQHTRAAMSARPTLADPTAPAGPTHVPIEKQEGPNPNPSLNPNPNPNPNLQSGARPRTPPRRLPTSRLEWVLVPRRWWRP